MSLAQNNWGRKQSYPKQSHFSFPLYFIKSAERIYGSVKIRVPLVAQIKVVWLDFYHGVPGSVMGHVRGAPRSSEEACAVAFW